MQEVSVKVRKLREDAQMPTCGTEYSAGADLRACLDAPLIIHPGETAAIHTGLSMELPEGTMGLIFARSGLASRQGLAPANKVGVVDSDYRGEFIVMLHNHSSVDQTIESGERIAQLVIVPYLKGIFEETDSLSETKRGAGGFGSTGTR